MSEHSDGSIVIDTSLDDTDLAEAIEKLNKTIEHLIQTINNLGEDIKSTFAGASSNISKMGYTAQQAAANMQQAGEGTRIFESSVTNTGDAARAAAENIAKAGQEAQSFGNDMSNTIKSAAFDKEINSIERSINSLLTQISKMGISLNAGFKSETQLQNFRLKFEQVSNTAMQLGERLKTLSSQTVTTSEFEKLSADIEKAERALFKLYGRRDILQQLGVSESSREWERLTIKIKEAEENLTRYERARDSLKDNGTGFSISADTEQFRQVFSDLQEVRNSLQNMGQELDRQEESAEGAAAGMSVFGTAMGSVAASALAATKQLAKMGIQTVLRSIQAGAKAAYKSFQLLSKGAKLATRGLTVFKKQSNKAILSVNGLTSALQKTLTGFKSMLIGRLKRKFISNIFSGIGEDILKLAKYFEPFNQAMSNIQNRSAELAANITVSISNFIMAAEPLLTQFINALSEAVSYFNAFIGMISGKSTVTVAKKQMKSYADSTDEAAESVKELKNQVYGFDQLNKRSSINETDKNEDTEDIFEEVNIDNLLPDNIKNFFQSIKDAVLANDWYSVGNIIADGLNNIITSADDWINNTLRPYGVLWAARIADIFNGITDGVNWEQLGRTLADGMNSVADTVNTFLTRLNFENLGIGLGNAVNSLFDWADWDLLGQTFANGWNSLIDTVYGLVSTLNFEDIGIKTGEFFQSFIDNFGIEKLAETISLGLTGIAQLINNTIDSIDFENLGSRVGNGLVTIFTKTDWNEVGAAVINPLNAVIDTIYGIVTTPNIWESMGDAVANFITGLAEKFKFQKLCEAAVVGVNGLITALQAAVDGVDWSGMTIRFARGISDFVTGIDWNGLGTLLVTGFNTLITMLADLIANIDWITLTSEFMNGLVTVITGIDWKETAGAVNALVTALLKTIATALLETDWFAVMESLRKGLCDLIEGIDWLEILVLLGDILIGLCAGIIEIWLGDIAGLADDLAEVFEGIGLDGVAGFFKGISDAMKSANDWIKKYLVDPVVDSVKSLFGIHSPSTVFAEIGEFLIEGFFKGISDTWDTITKFFEGAFKNLSSFLEDKWRNIAETAGTVWDGIYKTIRGIWDNLHTSADTVWGGITTFIKDGWESLSRTADTTWGSIKTNMSGTWKDAKTNAETACRVMIEKASGAWESIQRTASSKWQGITRTVSEKWDGLKRILSEKDWTSIGTNLVNGLKNGITKSWDSLTTTLGNLAGKLVDKVKEFFDIHSPSKVFAKIGEYLDLGLVKGINRGAGDVLKTISGLANSVIDSMETAEPEIDIAGNIDTNGFDDTISALTRIADIFESITDMISNMGGLITPQIAEGTVIPYKTKIDTSAPVNIDTDIFGGFTNDIDERLADQSDILRQLLDAVRKLNLNIDIDALTRAVTKQQRERTLNFGG